MVSLMTGALIFLTIFGIVSSAQFNAYDCRKYVFAPQCRGVAAKRPDPSSALNFEPPSELQKHSIAALLRTIYNAIGLLLREVEESDPRKSQLILEENLLRPLYEVLRVLSGNSK